MIHKVLWIEDGAQTECAQLPGPVFISGRYDLDVALNASEALRMVMENEYRAVVADIRIPPGDDERLIKLYGDTGFSKTTARLGIVLLYCLLMPNHIYTPIMLESIPSWVRPYRFGVLSVETAGEVSEDLRNLGITSYRNKQATVPRTILLELFDEIIRKEATHE